MSPNICFVCFKTFSTCSIPSEDENISLFVRFAKFAQNYLGISSVELILEEFIDNGGGGAPGRKEAFCEKCELALINPICHIYLQLLSLQLRLAWELGKLGRLLLQSSKTGVDDLKSLCEQLGVRSEGQLEEFRSSLISKCQLRGKVTLPKLQLERVGTATVPNPGFETGEDDKEPVSGPHSDFLNEETKVKMELERMGSECSGNDGDDLYEADNISNSAESFEADEKDKDWESEPSSRKRRTRSNAKTAQGEKSKAVIVEDMCPVPEWECEICGEATTNKSEHLEEHEKNSPEEEKVVQCYFCHLTFSFQLCLDDHLKSSHSSKLSKTGNFSCEVEECSLEFSTILDLNSHLSTHSSSLHICNLCSFVFIDESLLKLHSLLHIKPYYSTKYRRRRWPCPDCKKEDRSVEELQYHYNNQHGINCTKWNAFVNCKDCGEQLKCRSLLKIHRQLRHSPKTCSVCGENLSGSKGLADHMNLTHKTDFVCPTCDKSFKSESVFKAHMKRHADKLSTKDNDQLPTFKCKSCEKSFYKKYRLWDHVKVVHKKEPHVCPHCGKIYFAKKYLEAHMARYHREHSSQRFKLPYQCAHCPEKFRWKEILYRHLYKAHPDKEVVDGVLECEVCGLRVEKWRAGLMKRHMEKHIPVEERRSQGKMHICHVCGKEFLAVECYNEHVVNHEENQTESTLRCEICQKPFYYKHKLRDHLLTHQKGKEYANNDS